MECCPDSQTALEQMREISWLGAITGGVEGKAEALRRKECVELLRSPK